MYGQAGIGYIRMNGAGNEFIIFDARAGNFVMSAATARRVADKKQGLGCDQVVVIRPSDKANCRMQIYNADGSEVEACGNATRCVADIIMQEDNLDNVQIETAAGILEAESAGMGLVTVNMGRPRTLWQEIPLSEPQDTLSVKLEVGDLKNPVAVNMGNPHAVFFVRNVDEVNLDVLGPLIENHEMFPQRVNVGVAQVISADMIRLRVFERGAGETLACGTGCCAAVVAGNRLGIIDRRVMVKQKGGSLEIDWRKDGMVYMTGSVSEQIRGTYEIGRV